MRNHPMTDPELKTLNRLYEIAKDFEPIGENYFYLPGIILPREFPAPVSYMKGFSTIDGSIMEIPSTEPFSYSCSPKNSTWFADTAVDGVHYRFLHIDCAVREESPVIMTVPMNFDEPNFVVAENLLDYLSLGCRSTFDLQELAYMRTKMIEFLEHPERGLPYDNGKYLIPPLPEPYPELKILIEEFDLKPWENVEERLQYLRDKYLHLLIVENSE